MVDYNYETLQVDRVAERVLRVSLNRPSKVNAMNGQMIDEIWDVTEKLKHHETEASVVVLTGEGDKGFCGGLDVAEVFDATTISKVDLLYDKQMKLGETVLALRQMPQIVIASCFGSCVGGGFCYAMAADIRLIADNARFSAPFVKIKMGAADLGTSYLLPRLIGAGVASDILLTGRWMKAEEAMRLGFASECVPVDQLAEATAKKASELAQIDPSALRYSKEALRIGLDVNNLEDAILAEHRNQQLIMTKLWRQH